MFIEVHVHDRVIKKPALINVDHIISMVRYQDYCAIQYSMPDNWIKVTESYEEVCAMIGDSGEPTVKKIKLVGDMLEKGRITSNEARILLNLDEVE